MGLSSGSVFWLSSGSVIRICLLNLSSGSVIRVCHSALSSKSVFWVCLLSLSSVSVIWVCHLGLSSGSVIRVCLPSLSSVSLQVRLQLCLGLCADGPHDELHSILHVAHTSNSIFLALNRILISSLHLMACHFFLTSIYVPIPSKHSHAYSLHSIAYLGLAIIVYLHRIRLYVW